MAKKTLSVREIALFGVLAALTFGAKFAMSALPNIEPVTLFLMVFGAVYGCKSLFIVYVYVMAEILFFGLGMWNFNYLYIWVIPAALGELLRKMKNPLLWAFVAGLFGLTFGALCAPVDLVIGGMSFAVSKWISGIPFDAAHCAGNFVLTLLLFTPLRSLTERLKKTAASS